MTPTVAIGVISQVLALCGLVSIRMFLPVFLYFLAMRLTLFWPDHAPELIRQMAEHTPAWQTSTFFLTVFGVLAALELAAVRNPDIKTFLVEGEASNIKITTPDDLVTAEAIVNARGDYNANRVWV